eukprot:15444981-Alexandrium_andersonii.AAC.2
MGGAPKPSQYTPTHAGRPSAARRSCRTSMIARPAAFLPGRPTATSTTRSGGPAASHAAWVRSHSSPPRQSKASATRSRMRWAEATP